jgi:hypothetical protein
MFHAYVQQFDREETKSVFVNGQKNSVTTFIRHVLDQNQYSVRKNTISQSVPVDWRSKVEDNAAKIRALFKEEKVDIIINADETFVLFHMQSDHVIVPKGINRVGTAAQVDNEKMGSTVLIAAEY